MVGLGVAVLMLLVAPGCPLTRQKTSFLSGLIDGLIDLYAVALHQRRAGVQALKWVGPTQGQIRRPYFDQCRDLDRACRRGIKLKESLAAVVEVLRHEAKVIADIEKCARVYWWRALMVWATCALAYGALGWFMPRGIVGGSDFAWPFGLLQGVFAGTCLIVTVLLHASLPGSWCVDKDQVAPLMRDWLAAAVNDEPAGCFNNDPTYAELWRRQWADGVSTRAQRLDHLRDYARDQHRSVAGRRESAAQLMPLIETLTWSAAALCLIGPAAADIFVMGDVVP